MKEFDHYTTYLTPFFGIQDMAQLEVEIVEAINKAAAKGEITPEERKHAESCTRDCANDVRKNYATIRQAEINDLQKEFFEDARKDLGYENWLTDEGISILEGKAWDDGHKDGYSEVYQQLKELLEFYEDLLKNSISIPLS